MIKDYNEIKKRKEERITTIKRYLEVKNGNIELGVLTRMMYNEFGTIHGVSYDTVAREVFNCLNEYKAEFTSDNNMNKSKTR